jgi:uncharacterized protein
MIHPDTELRFISDAIGYGVFATRPILRGTIVWTLCLFDRVYTPAQAAALPYAYQQMLAKYGYIDAAGDYVLCWDAGRYVNHGCEPAMLGAGPETEIAVRDIQPGDHVTCEYGGLNLTNPMPCTCGSPRCRGRVRAEDALEQWREWDRLVAQNLPLAAKVEQPLLPFMRDPARFREWVEGRAPVPSHREYYAGAGSAPPGETGGLPWAIPRAKPGA